MIRSHFAMIAALLAFDAAFLTRPSIAAPKNLGDLLAKNLESMAPAGDLLGPGWRISESKVIDDVSNPPAKHAELVGEAVREEMPETLVSIAVWRFTSQPKDGSLEVEMNVAVYESSASARRAWTRHRALAKERAKAKTVTGIGDAAFTDQEGIIVARADSVILGSRVIQGPDEVGELLLENYLLQLDKARGIKSRKTMKEFKPKKPQVIARGSSPDPGKILFGKLETLRIDPKSLGDDWTLEAETIIEDAYNLPQEYVDERNRQYRELGFPQRFKREEMIKTYKEQGIIAWAEFAYDLDFELENGGRAVVHIQIFADLESAAKNREGFTQSEQSRNFRKPLNDWGDFGMTDKEGTPERGSTYWYGTLRIDLYRGTGRPYALDVVRRETLNRIDAAIAEAGNNGDGKTRKR